MKRKEFKRVMNSFLWLLIYSLLIFAKCDEISSTDIITSLRQKDDIVVHHQGVKDPRGLFSPRMDYDQWKPLGRGDPLKNDPTYDYVPPVLDKVHYWIDPASRKPDSAHPDEVKKTEILVLGVSSRKPSTGFSTLSDIKRDSYDPFIKYVEGPNFNVQSNYQHIQRPHYSMPQQSFYTSFYKNKPEQKEPSTILIPPPLTISGQEQPNYQQLMMSSTSTTTPASMMPSSTTPSLKSIEESNLIYQSSSLSTLDDWKGSHTYATIAESSSQVTRKVPISNSPPNSTQNIQQLPLVRAPDTFKETSSYSIIPSLQTSMNVLIKPMTKLSNTKNIGTDIIVASPEMPMHKGQVTDDTLDLSSTYVSIGKPDAQMQSATGLGIDVMPISKRPVIKPNNMLLNSPLLSSVLNPHISSMGNHMQFHKPTIVKKPDMPMTLQTIHSMQTMQPPPSIHNQKKPLPLLHNLLRKEVLSTSTSTTTTTTTTTTTISPPTTTSISSLTTDPLFKHYKQPMEPLRGPLYLIIQGHSKVKTYGPSKQINGISVQETNEIPTSDDRQTEYPVKHLHERMKDNHSEWDKEREKRIRRSGRLQTLNHVVMTGFGAIDIPESGQLRRSDQDVKETELIVKYDVSSAKEVTSEVYHKGIVESEVAPNRRSRPTNPNIHA